FGRNVTRKATMADPSKLMAPNPLLVSEKLLARKTFIPATTLNLLAAAWIQFQVHDWMGHESEDLDGDKKHHVPKAGDWTDPEMVLPKTKPDPGQDFP